MEQGDNKFILLLIFLLFGIVVTIQVRSTMQANKQKSSSVYEVEQLKSLLNEEKKISESLKASINKNEKSLEANLKSAVSYTDNSNLKELVNELDYAKLKAGLTDVKGQGIVIKLDDASIVKKNQDVSFFIIHDSDVKKILNELKKAGAQAISINGERIISTSIPICAGPTILINKNRYPVPYTIKAIGNPDELYKKLDECGTVVEMRLFGIKVTIEKAKEVIVNRYSNDDVDKLVEGMEVIGK